ncbi:MAG: class D sortase [Deltaproteobacteria bacterium]|jgi:sortase A|nr:class D sortase [Deltaproteobacteria bacterium]
MKLLHTQTDSHAASRRRARRQRALQAAERLLLGVGLACLTVYVTACAERSFFQSRQGRGFDQQLELALGEEAHDQSEWSAKRVDRFQILQSGEFDALGRLEIPRAGVSVMVLEGTADATLDRAVGHIDGTARPGEDGNIGIAGHRDSFFRGLRHLETGDVLSFATREGLAQYEVAEISIVAPQDVEVLDPTDEPALTLVTCYPFYFVGNAPKRFIVRAHRVAFDDWSRDRLDRYTARPTELAHRGD